MRDKLILFREFTALAGWRGIWLFCLRALQRTLSPDAYERVARITWMRTLKGSKTAGLTLELGWERDFFVARFPQADLVREAEGSRRQEFHFLGTKPSDWKGSCEWSRDPKSGHRWPQRFYGAYGSSLTPGDGVDIKIPWELARFQHALPCAQAYWQTGEIIYRNHYLAAWRDWVDANLWGYGIHWTNPMDVAIRAVNWLVGMSLLGGENALPAADRKDFVQSLRQHGIFIESNLELGVVGGQVEANNHFLADVCGLACLGLVCPELPEARRWRRMGIKGLEREILRQVYDDGFSFESSTNYHRLALELFLVPLLLGAGGQGMFSQVYRGRLEGMLETVAGLTGPDGSVPQVGDNDDGRLLIPTGFSRWERHDYRYLLGIGAALFNRGDFKGLAGECPQEVFWLLGRRGVEAYDAVESDEPSGTCKAFPQGGFYVMQSPDRKAYGLVRTGQAAAGATGHFHNDVLGVEIWLGGRPILLDPGTLTYTSDPEERNLMRSTRMHNTVEVDGKEINEIPANLFRMGRNAAVEVLRWQLTDRSAEFVAAHDGYARLEPPVGHQRAILFQFEEAVFTIEDELEGRDSHTGVWNWHFFQKDRLNVTRIRDGMRITGEGFVMDMETGAGKITEVETNTSLRALTYGRATPYTRVRTQVDWSDRGRVRTVLREVQG